jgi:hypothetical protein
MIVKIESMDGLQDNIVVLSCRQFDLQLIGKVQENNHYAGKA